MITLYVHIMTSSAGKKRYLASYGCQAELTDEQMVEYVRERMTMQNDHYLLGYLDRKDYVITRQNMSLAQFYSQE